MKKDLYWEAYGDMSVRLLKKPLFHYIVFLIILSSSIYAFQVFWEKNTGQIFGKEDITNYYQKNGLNDEKYILDVNHWATLNIMQRYGYPFMTSYLFYLFAPLCFYWMYRGLFTEAKSVLASLYTLFFTSYMAHATYVGVLSQSIAFMFFCLMIGYQSRHRHSEMIYFGLIGSFFHLVSMFPIALIIFFSGLKIKNRNILIVSILMFMSLGYYLFTNVNILETTILTSKLSYEPSMSYIMLKMNNPILMASASIMSPVYIIYMLLSMLVHNGRMTMFFIPFMISSAIKDKTPKQMVYMTFLCLFWMADMQLNFIGQTLEYMKNAGFMSFLNI